MNAPMVQGKLLQSGYFFMGLMPALIAGMVLVLTRTGEASRFTQKDRVQAGGATLIVAVGNSSLGVGGLPQMTAGGGLPPGVLPGGIPGMKGLPPVPGPTLPGGANAAQYSAGTALSSGGRDTLYVLYVRPPSGMEGKLLGQGFDGNRMTVAAYRTTIMSTGGNRNGDTKLGAVRECAYDLKIPALDQETMREVHDMKKKYEEATKPGQPADEKKKKK